MVDSKIGGTGESLTKMPTKTISYGEGKSITVRTGAFAENIQSESFIKGKPLGIREPSAKRVFDEKVFDKAIKAGIGRLDEIEPGKLNKAQENALVHAYRKDFEGSDEFTSINLINSFVVKNSSDKVGMEDIFFTTNGMTLSHAKNISIGSIDVMSTQLSNSLGRLLNSLPKKGNTNYKELKANAKLAGKLAQSLGRLVPGATMGALKSTANDTRAGRISKVLNKIESVCEDIGKIEKKSKKGRDELIENIKSLRTPENYESFVKSEMPGFMKEFEEASFKYEETGANLTAEKIGVDLRMNQMIDTIVDLMEDLDKEHNVELGDEYYDRKTEFEKDVQDTFAKLGLLLNNKGIGALEVRKEDLMAGFLKARETRNVMKNIRNMPMFSEFKYADLNKNLTKNLFASVLELDPENDKDLISGFYENFKKSKEDVEKEIENVKKGNKAEKKEIGEAIEQIKNIEDKIKGIESKIKAAKGNKDNTALERELEAEKEALRKEKEELIFGEFKRKQVSFNHGGGIDVEQAARLLIAIDAEFDKLVEETGAFRGGMRGRNREIFNLRFNEATGAFNLQVEFGEGKNPIFKKFNVETGSFENVDIKALNEQISDFNEILKEITKNKTFAHSYQTNVTADHDALKKEWVDIINKPTEFLKKAALNNKDLESLIDKANEGALRDAILDTETGNKLVTEETLRNLVEEKGDDRKSVRSFAGIIEDNGLRTICGPSGTTTDTIVGMFGLFGKDFIMKALKPLGELLGTIKSDVKDAENVARIVKEIGDKENKEFDNLKKIFSSIANYMINGQYHSPGEVLSGLSTAALSVMKYENNIDQKDGIDQKKPDAEKKEELEKLKVKNNHVKEFAVQADVICKVLGDKESAKWLFPNAA